jgi:hypothetical protein
LGDLLRDENQKFNELGGETADSLLFGAGIRIVFLVRCLHSRGATCNILTGCKELINPTGPENLPVTVSLQPSDLRSDDSVSFSLPNRQNITVFAAAQ